MNQLHQSVKMQRDIKLFIGWRRYEVVSDLGRTSVRFGCCCCWQKRHTICVAELRRKRTFSNRIIHSSRTIISFLSRNSLLYSCKKKTNAPLCYILTHAPDLCATSLYFYKAKCTYREWRRYFGMFCGHTWVAGRKKPRARSHELRARRTLKSVFYVKGRTCVTSSSRPIFDNGDLKQLQ